MTDEAAHVEQLKTVLQRDWGYTTFRPLQKEAMLACLRQRDSLVVLPTGAGKSLCYQAPAVCSDGTAIIVSPLISLMKDQVDAARNCGIAASFLNSTLDGQERMSVMRDLRSGAIKLLYMAPERLMTPAFLDMLEETPISFFAIDEAHCVSQWGHDFRPHYRALSELRDRFPSIAVHAFTATATERVRDDIAQQLQLRDPEILVGGFDRPNLQFRVTRKNDLLGQIRQVLDRYRDESGVIYCVTRKEVERVATALKACGYSVAPYHAGMDDADRKRNQELFIQDEVQAIVATVAFGMGIDKSNIRYVVHAGMPQSIEHYQQESGRAGRDGLEAECCLFYGGDDVITWKKIHESAAPEQRKIALESLRKVQLYCEGMTCRHRMLVQHFGQDLEQDCGTACDVCDGDQQLVEDSLIVSQKIMSSIFRQQQRFGIDYTILVLRGSKDRRILENGHDSLTTHGILKDESRETLISWINQLIQQQHLAKEGEYDVLKIQPSGWQVLKGEITPKLLRPQDEGPAGGGTSDTKAGKASPESWEGVDRELFDRLREVRAGFAKERSVPAFTIFADSALRDMARRRPSTVEAFLQVSGVGQKKQEDFGAAFVSAITDYCAEHSVAMDIQSSGPVKVVRPAPTGPSMSAMAAFPLFEQKVSVEDAAVQLARARSTVLGYLEEYVRFRQVQDVSPWVDPETVQSIRKAVEVVGAERLKPIYLHLNEAVGYDQIRLVLAADQNAVGPG
jgi:ATP-dependent DNA helicase RecQ